MARQQGYIRPEDDAISRLGLVFLFLQSCSIRIPPILPSVESTILQSKSRSKSNYRDECLYYPPLECTMVAARSSSRGIVIFESNFFIGATLAFAAISDIET